MSTIVHAHASATHHLLLQKNQKIMELEMRLSEQEKLLDNAQKDIGEIFREVEQKTQQ